MSPAHHYRRIAPPSFQNVGVHTPQTGRGGREAANPVGHQRGADTVASPTRWANGETDPVPGATAPIGGPMRCRLWAIQAVSSPSNPTDAFFSAIH